MVAILVTVLPSGAIAPSSGFWAALLLELMLCPVAPPACPCVVVSAASRAVGPAERVCGRPKSCCSPKQRPPRSNVLGRCHLCQSGLTRIGRSWSELAGRFVELFAKVCKGANWSQCSGEVGQRWSNLVGRCMERISNIFQSVCPDASAADSDCRAVCEYPVAVFATIPGSICWMKYEGSRRHRV